MIVQTPHALMAMVTDTTMLHAAALTAMIQLLL
jgi:hypothetical protein